MSRVTGLRMWIAVRVQRGFVTDVRAYENEQSARRKERAWKHQMNRDYDETSVSKVRVIVHQNRPCRNRDSSNEIFAKPNEFRRCLL